MRLMRALLTLAVLGGVIYLGATVPLGGKTLWEHIKAIAGTKESKELVDGVKQKAEQIVVRPDGGVGDKLTDAERRLLRKLIREKLSDGKHPAPDKPPPKRRPVQQQ